MLLGPWTGLAEAGVATPTPGNLGGGGDKNCKSGLQLLAVGTPSIFT